MLDIQTVTVIGATGTMGANIAGIFASFGDAKVYCVGRDIEKVKRIMPRIVNSVKADAIADNLIPADYTMLEDCVKESDLIIESSKEDITIKKDIAKQVASKMAPHAISGTGTSGLSVTEIAKCYPENLKKRFFGIHLFNPPYTLPLCELISTPFSDKSVHNDLKDYLDKKLRRTVVEVKDSPAFLGNRIGFQFINEAMQYAEKYRDNGGIDYIDALLGPFTGRIMAPLATSDFVGLDVHKAIVENLYENTNDYARGTFVLPQYVQKLIAEGKLGRKSGGGLYRQIKYENGLKRRTVYDINTDSYRDVISYAFPYAESMKMYIAEGEYKKAIKCLINNHSIEANISVCFLLKYIVYSLYATEKVGDKIEASDDVMATGFNWCPPMALFEALSETADVESLISERTPELSSSVDIERILKHIQPSKYDYRRYFRTGR